MQTEKCHFTSTTVIFCAETLLLLAGMIMA